MDFTLIQLRYFCRVAETGTFSGAAVLEHISATAVASAVESLERALGAQLCVRQRSRGVQLTATGQLLYTEATRLLTEAEELRLLIAGNPDELVGPLTVGSYSTFAPTVLPGILEEFEKRFPKVTVNVTVQSQEALLKDLDAGKIDCALLYDIQLPEGLEKQRLYDAPIHVILSAEHPLAEQESVSLEDLRGEPLILLDSTPAGAHTLRVLEERGFAPQIRHRVKEYEVVRSMVARNLGYSLMIHRNPAKFSYEGLPLVELPIVPEMPLESLVAVWPARVRLNPRTRELIRITREVVSASHP